MAQVFCPKCNQPGLVLESQEMACPRKGCGYRGLRVVVHLAGDEPDRVLTSQLRLSDLNFFSVGDVSLEDYLADVGQLYTADGLPIPEAPTVVEPELAHLDVVAEALYAEAHGILPGDLTEGPGRTAARRLVPILRALARKAWREGAANAIEDLDGCHGCASSNGITVDAYRSPYEEE